MRKQPSLVKRIYFGDGVFQRKVKEFPKKPLFKAWSPLTFCIFCTLCAALVGTGTGKYLRPRGLIFHPQYLVVVAAAVWRYSRASSKTLRWIYQEEHVIILHILLML